VRGEEVKIKEMKKRKIIRKSISQSPQIQQFTIKEYKAIYERKK